MDLETKLIAAAQELGPITGFSSGFSANPGSYPQGRFTAILSNIITVLTIFGGLAFLFWFVIGALSWITSSGNEEQVNKAKSQISTALAGLLVLILAYGIFFILSEVTGLELLNIEETINRLIPSAGPPASN